MAILANLIKAVFRSVLLNKTARYALIAGLLRIGSYIIRPSSLSRISSFLKSFSAGLGRAAAGSGRSGIPSSLLRGALELLLLNFARKGGLSGAGLFSALAAVILAAGRGGKQHPSSASRGTKEQIIDLDDYTILDDNHQ